MDYNERLIKEKPVKDTPKYCPFCGADAGVNGHDDDCGRPESVKLVTKCAGLETEPTIQYLS